MRNRSVMILLSLLMFAFTSCGKTDTEDKYSPTDADERFAD